MAISAATLAGCASSASNSALPQATPLWAGTPPGPQGPGGSERTTIRTDGGVSFQILENVNSPSITPFLPAKDKATGVAVIIAPGGGHQFLAIEHEGWTVGRVLADDGIAGFVLKYRLSKEKNSPYKMDDELMDVQRAIRLVRARAADWGVDPHKIGIMGFSAGGELAMLASTRYANPIAGSDDDIDRMDCRPDFQALIYPGGLNHPESIAVTRDTPPAFLACSYNDRPTISENLAKFYLMLKSAGVPAELHIYESGGHGWGIRPTTRPVGTWPELFVAWVRDRGLIGGR
jgi:acetyl esterase/lipase